MTTPPQSTTDSRSADDDDQYREPPADAYPAPDRQIPVSAALIRSALDSLERVEDFFRRYAKAGVHDDPRAYALAQGWQTTTGPEAFLDTIAFTAAGLNRALDPARPEQDPHTA